MGKLNLVVEDAPVRENKNTELYQEVVDTFNALPIGKCVVVTKDQVPLLALIPKIKGLVTLKPNEEDIRISRVYGSDKKLSGLKLVKQAWKPKKTKTESQGTSETPEAK